MGVEAGRLLIGRARETPFNAGFRLLHPAGWNRTRLVTGL
jgi:hypothetical protein